VNNGMSCIIQQNVARCNLVLRENGIATKGKCVQIWTIRGLDSVIGIAIRYGLDGPGVECRWE
jgi:hypothetical protein